MRCSSREESSAEDARTESTGRIELPIKAVEVVEDKEPLVESLALVWPSKAKGLGLTGKYRLGDPTACCWVTI